MSPRFQDLLPVLADCGVRFIVIGGVAASMHGAARATYDIDGGQQLLSNRGGTR